MIPFFVTGLPRSRTSWLANLLTYVVTPGSDDSGGGRSICYHDLMKGCDSTQQLIDVLESTMASLVGDSDSGLLWLFPELELRYPTSKWIVVRRSAVEAAISYWNSQKRHPYRWKNLSGGAPPVDWEPTKALFKRLDGVCDKVVEHLPAERCLEVDFKALNDERVCREIAEFVGVAFDGSRWEVLDTMRMEPCAERITLDARRLRKFLEGA